MRLRHAVAFTMLLVTGCASTSSSGGWLLLVPQINQAGYPTTDEPLPKWQTVGNFASQIDCTTFLQNHQSVALAEAGQITNAQNYYQTQAVQILAGRCVSTDDPGLKLK